MKHLYRKIIERRNLRIVEYYVYKNSTVRKTALYFGVSKSYVHRILGEFQVSNETSGSELAQRIKQQIKKNTKERARRGGMATKAKFLEKQK